MPRTFRNADIDPRRWTTNGVWEFEPREEALARVPAFGRRFFALLFAEFPALEQEACFLRWTGQPEDVYAVFDLSTWGFSVQIDPHLGYIITHGDDAHAEFGDWFEDQAQFAVDYLRHSYLDRGRD